MFYLLLVGMAIATLAALSINQAPVRLSIWTPLWIGWVLFMLASIGYIYAFKLDSAFLLTHEFKASMNFPRPVISTRGEKTLGGLAVWRYQGFGAASHRRKYSILPIAWKDSRHIVFRDALAPEPLASGSDVFTSPARLMPLDDNGFDGIFPAQRDALLSNPGSTYKPKEAEFAALFAGLLHVDEADISKETEVAETLGRGALISIARRFARSPEREQIKLLRGLEKAARKSPKRDFMIGASKEEDANDKIERERGREGIGGFGGQ